MSLDKKQAITIAQKSTLYIVIFFLLTLCIIPFYLMIVNGTRASADIITGISFLPGSMAIQNYVTLSKSVNIFRGLLNSAIVATVTTFLSSYIAALAGYGFAFYNFPFKKSLFTMVLVLMMVPPHLGLIGYFELCNQTNLLDTLAAVILPGVASTFVVFFLRQYIKSVMHESLIEAARIDGASELSIFHKIAIPLMLPGIAVMGIFTFVANWNNYILPLIVLFSETNFTVPMLIAQLNSTAHRADFGAIYMGIAISVIPILVAFALLARYIIAGISLGSVKE